MGLTWAAAWFAAGVAMAVFVIGLKNVEEPFPIVFGFLGFLAGAAFSGLLGIVERRRRFDQMSLSRFAAWGALGGLLLAAAMGIVAGIGPDLTVMAIVFSLAGATSAAGTLAIARRAERHAALAAPSTDVTPDG